MPISEPVAATILHAIGMDSPACVRVLAACATSERHAAEIAFNLQRPDPNEIFELKDLAGLECSNER